MAGILDLLHKAAGTGDSTSTAPQGKGDAGIDIGKMAQEAADTAKASQYKGAPYPKTPSGLSSTMTPQKPNGGAKGN